MSYSIYTDEMVFQDANANIACNLVHQLLIDATDAATVQDHFFLTGMAARIVQGTAPQEVTVISFGTENDALFGVCQKINEQLGASGSVIFKDQIQMVYSENIFIEVWLLPTPGTLVVVKEIVMQDQANIPAYII